MTESDTPAKVATSAVLGQLPEPAAMTTRYEVVPPGQGSAMSPVGTVRARGRVAVGYTADQMSAYAAAEVARAVAVERERCATIARNKAWHCEEHDNHYGKTAALDIEDAIRGMGPNVAGNRLDPVRRGKSG